MSNLRIIYKLMILVAVLALVITVVAGAGIMGLQQIVAGAQSIAVSGKQSLLGARMNQNTIALNRAEYMVATDPSPENVAAATKDTEDELKKFTDRLAQLRQAAVPEDQAALDKIEAAFNDYRKEMEGTFDDAKRLQAQINISGAQKELIDGMKDSRVKADAFRVIMRSFGDTLSKRAEDLADAAASTGRTAQMTMIAIGLIGIFGGGAFGFILARFSINKPLSAGLDCLRKLSTGDSSVEIYGTGRKDEIGDLAAAMEVFKDNLIKSAEMQAREAEAQAERTKRAELIANLTQNFDQEASSIVRALAAAATEMRATASSMSGTAEETARQSSAVAAASEQTSANVQTVAAATEELSSSVVEIGRQVSESASMSAEAVRKAEETNTTVNSLSEAAKRIGSVVQLINDIASQTNLLALNATIEAARAGEAGKGFAVVASEVKNLANQTSKATDEIGQQIGSMQQATEAAVSAILDIKGIIGRLNSIATGIASAVEEQGAATQEISRNVQQAAEGTQDVSRNIVSVNQAANETGSAATQLLSGAEDLSQQAEGLRGKVETFINGVKSA